MNKFYAGISLQQAKQEANNCIQKIDLIRAAYNQLPNEYDLIDPLFKIAELEDIYTLFKQEGWQTVSYEKNQHKLFIVCEKASKTLRALREAFFFSGGRITKIYAPNDKLVVANLSTTSVESFLTKICCYTFAETLIDDLNLLAPDTIITRSVLITAKKVRIAKLEADLGNDISALKLIIS